MKVIFKFILMVLIGALIGSVSIMFISWPLSKIAGCAVGQDLSKRDTVGEARFAVNYHDGDYTTIVCTSKSTD
jgi:hypothetical protein